jgi:mono/diheme cytochrome c family protein
MFRSFKVSRGSATRACAIALGVFSLQMLACASKDPVEEDIASIADPAERGKRYMAKRDCGSCHQSSDPADGICSGQTTPQMGTMAYGKNLTPDMTTGLGAWTDDEIKAAIRTGMNRDGMKLCATMQRYVMSDKEINDIVYYLRHIPAVMRTIPPSVCP